MDTEKYLFRVNTIKKSYSARVDDYRDYTVVARDAAEAIEKLHKSKKDLKVREVVIVIDIDID